MEDNLLFEIKSNLFELVTKEKNKTPSTNQLVKYFETLPRTGYFILWFYHLIMCKEIYRLKKKSDHNSCDDKVTKFTKSFTNDYYLTTIDKLWSDHIANEKQTKRRNELVGNFH